MQDSKLVIPAKPRPIFVGGCERSGTTLLAALMAEGAKTIAVPESQFLVELLRDPPTILNTHPRAMAETSGSVFRAAIPSRVLSNWRFLLWELDLSPAERATILASNDVGELGTNLAEVYATTLGGRAPGSIEAWVDHTPWNLKHAALLLMAFPDARFIHIIRDGRGVAASVKPLAWGPNDALASAHWWMGNVAMGLAVEEWLGPERVLRVSYEDLVRDSEAVIQKVWDFAGLAPMVSEGTNDNRAAEANARLLTGTYTQFVAPTYTQSQHRLLRLAPDVSRIDAWRSELTAREIELFESVAEVMLAHLGYYCHHGGRARGPTVAEQVAREITELLRFYIVNPPRNRARRIAVRARAKGWWLPAKPGHP